MAKIGARACYLGMAAGGLQNKLNEYNHTRCTT